MLHAHDESVRAHLLEGGFGLEKESLRIDGGGFLAHTPADFADDVHIVRDFSENQVEVNTPVCATPAEAIQSLEHYNGLVQRAIANLPERELLWPFSNPPYILNEKDIPIAQYFGDDAKNTTISLVEAKNILDEKIDKCSVTYAGKILTESKSVWNKTFLLGSDALGRDLFIRVVYGARMSLTVGIFAALVNFIIGVFYGCFAGYKGGNVDTIMMRIVDVIDSVPVTLYVILIMVVIGSGMQSIILALGLTYWVRMARIVRGQVLSLKNSEFVLAAKTLGASTGRIFVKHLIPNMMGTIMVAIAMQIPNAIFTEAFLSFIGLGIPAPKASWGTLCNDALSSIYVYPYQLLIPAIAISVTILAFNLFSDGLRDAFDPKQRK